MLAKDLECNVIDYWLETEESWKRMLDMMVEAKRREERGENGFWNIYIYTSSLLYHIVFN